MQSTTTEERTMQTAEFAADVEFTRQHAQAYANGYGLEIAEEYADHFMSLFGDDIAELGLNEVNPPSHEHIFHPWFRENHIS